MGEDKLYKEKLVEIRSRLPQSKMSPLPAQSQDFLPIAMAVRSWVKLQCVQFSFLLPQLACKFEWFREGDWVRCSAGVVGEGL